MCLNDLRQYLYDHLIGKWIKINVSFYQFINTGRFVDCECFGILELIVTDQEFNQYIVPIVVDKFMLSVVDLNKYSIDFFETSNDEYYSSFNNLAMPYIGIRLKEVGDNCLESI